MQVRIATTARNAGATPVFVPYHLVQPSEDVMRTVATELEVRFVDMSQIFGREFDAYAMRVKRWGLF